MSDLVIGIDPAYGKPTAVSYLYKEKLHHFQLPDVYDFVRTTEILAEYLPNSEKTPVLIIEGQEIYKFSPVKSEVILELANRTGFIEACVRMVTGCSVLRVAPKKWKGNVPPRVLMNRVEKQVGILPGNKQEREDYAHSTGLIHYYLKNQKHLVL
jgi:hypothetical protein